MVSSPPALSDELSWRKKKMCETMVEVTAHKTKAIQTNTATAADEVCVEIFALFLFIHG